MDQKDILETVICEMTERALAIRRETCEEAEQQLEEKMERWMYLEDLAARIERGEEN